MPGTPTKNPPCGGFFVCLVPKGGLEPPRPKSLPPQGSASTNSAICAFLPTPLPEQAVQIVPADQPPLPSSTGAGAGFVASAGALAGAAGVMTGAVAGASPVAGAASSTAGAAGTGAGASTLASGWAGVTGALLITPRSGLPGAAVARWVA